MTSPSQPQAGPPHQGPGSVTARDAFRRRRSKRQTAVFGVAILGMVVALALGFLGLTGSILLPIGDEFSKKEVFAAPGSPPCPTAGARPVDPEGARVRVFNTSSRPGLATAVGESLEALGYELAGADNAPSYRGNVKIEAGPRGVDDAYTVARYFGSDTRIVLTDAEDRTLTITLGLNFEGMPPQGEIDEIFASHTALLPLEGCEKVQEPVGGWELQSDQSGQSGQSGEDSTPSDEATEENSEA